MVRDYNIILGLESISALCKLLGNPQDKFKSIHITGTNGKGSTGAYIESILIESGYTVGRYTSPAVFNHLETITINRIPISSQDYTIYSNHVRKVSDRLDSMGIRRPSQFELETAIAFEYLSTRCDIAIIEVGMGGRLDATNVLHNKILSIITSIGLDHTEYLGDTIEEITTEKCGIIQKRVPTVTILQDTEILKTIERICKERSSPLIIANRGNVSNVKMTENYILTFDYLDYMGLESKMIGDFQIDNAILSIMACETLNVHRKAIVRGISNAVWRYRFEPIKTNPLVILDGCHNESAAKRIRVTLDSYFPNMSICYVMGIFKDKDYTSIARHLCDRADCIYTVSTDGNRSLSAKALAEVVRKYNLNVTPCDSIDKAIELSKAANTDMILIFGSLSTLSQFDNF